MRVYENVIENDKKVQKVLCNCCGKEIAIQQGYFSEKDGRQDNFDLCENCYDNMVKHFVIPVSQ